MGQIEKLYNAIRFVGLDSLVRSFIYAQQREQFEKRYTPPSPTSLVPPGALRHSELLPQGARLSFDTRTLEIQFLDSDVARITWDNAALPPPYAIAEKKWPGSTPSAAQKEDGGWRLATSALEIHVSGAGAVQFFRPNGGLLASFAAPFFSSNRWRLPVAFQPDERIYGFGERAISVDRRGHTLTLWNSEAGGSYHLGDYPLYLNTPMWMGVHEHGGCLAFIENSFRSEFDLGAEPSITFDGGALRVYFIPGQPAETLPRFLELTGKPPLPPRWALGYHQSRWGYKTEGDIRHVVESFKEHDLPIHVIHLDIDYMRGYRVFTIDPDRFPNLSQLSQDLSKQNIRLVTILDPGVKVDPKYRVYRNGLDADVFCKMPDRKEIPAPVWPGWCFFPDFTSPTVRSWWGAQYKKLVDNGVAGYWHDMNEPSAFTSWGDATLPSAVRHDLEGRKGDHCEAHNLFGLLMNRAAFEGLRKLQPEKRPWMVTRSGWAGIGRYAWKWSGDVSGTWEMLRGTVALLLGLSMSGVYFVGSDIGGFSNHPSPELYTRWFQMASFTPFFRTHSATSLPSREPWCFGDQVLNICREALKLRTRLYPYYYTLAWQAAEHGLPLMRPLFWNEPNNRALWGADDVFLLGNHLLIAPILDQGREKRTVPLPSGCWYDFHSGQDYDGNQTIEIRAPLERTPVFIKSGSVIPMEEGKRLELHVFAPRPGDNPMTSTLYSDAGDGYGASRLDSFEVIHRENRLDILWQSIGEFPWPYAQVEWILHGNKASRAVQSGASLEVKADRCAGQPLSGISFM